MTMDLHILPECYVDTNLIETIVPPTKSGYNHKKGCDNVVKAMLETSALKDSFALGIVDEDKEILEYSKEFELITDQKQLKLLKHPQKNHYLIYVIPAVEKWIIHNADEVNISLVDFNLPHDYSLLRKYSKVVTSNRDIKFKNLFKSLQKQEATGVMLLSKWINYLKTHPYDADLDFFNEK
jgi:hypothetical protein